MCVRRLRVGHPPGRQHSFVKIDHDFFFFKLGWGLFLNGGYTVIFPPFLQGLCDFLFHNSFAFCACLKMFSLGEAQAYMQEFSMTSTVHEHRLSC